MIREHDTFHVVAWMTLLCALFYGSGQWYFTIPMGIVVSVGILFREAIQHELFWLVVCLLVGCTLFFDWFILGNHDYLVAYWCLAIFLSRLTQDSEKVLALAGRWLIAVVFALAVFWKIASPFVGLFRFFVCVQKYAVLEAHLVTKKTKFRIGFASTAVMICYFTSRSKISKNPRDLS